MQVGPTPPHFIWGGGRGGGGGGVGCPIPKVSLVRMIFDSGFFLPLYAIHPHMCILLFGWQVGGAEGAGGWLG